MKIVILILSAFYLTACAVKSEEKQTTDHTRC
jgi:outer membrane biogenesis lipoprotein LolB